MKIANLGVGRLLGIVVGLAIAVVASTNSFASRSQGATLTISTLKNWSSMNHEKILMAELSPKHKITGVPGDTKVHPLKSISDEYPTERLLETETIAVFSEPSLSPWCKNYGIELSVVFKKGFDVNVELNQSYILQFEEVILPVVKSKCSFTDRIRLSNYVSSVRISSAGRLYEYGELPDGHNEQPLNTIWARRSKSGGYCYSILHFGLTSDSYRFPHISSVSDLIDWRRRGSPRGKQELENGRYDPKKVRKKMGCFVK